MEKEPNYIKEKIKYDRIIHRVEDEVGNIEGIRFLILLMYLFEDTAEDFINDEKYLEGMPDDVIKACHIIIEELKKE